MARFVLETGRAQKGVRRQGAVFSEEPVEVRRLGVRSSSYIRRAIDGETKIDNFYARKKVLDKICKLMNLNFFTDGGFGEEADQRVQEQLQHCCVPVPAADVGPEGDRREWCRHGLVVWTASDKDRRESS